MNIIRPEIVETEARCPKVDDPAQIRDEYSAYMTDESRLAPQLAETIFFPTSTDEVVAAVREISKSGRKIVVSGARTGISGGAVVTQNRCAIISLEKMVSKPVVRFDGQKNQWQVNVGVGITLEELNKALDNGDFETTDDVPETGLFYPVDPTEQSAQIGGTIATNASGARTYFYGPTRDWVEWITVVLTDGRILKLRRGEVRADGRSLLLENVSRQPQPITLPEISMPRTKSTLGYFIDEGMDAVDLFVGSEGTLGIITEVELRLIEKPQAGLYLCQYFKSEEKAIDFVIAITGQEKLKPHAIEYFDPDSITLLRAHKETAGESSGVPQLPETAAAVIFLEFECADEDQIEELTEQLSEMLDELGVSIDDSWAGFDENDLEKMKKFRHALPETVNSLIGQRKLDIPEIHKVGTDMAVPIEHLKEMMRIYRSTLTGAGLESATWGHIGDAHLHINILPKNSTELKQAKEIYIEFARKVVAFGGAASAEHGIGKIKREFLKLHYSNDILDQLRAIKRAFDPDETLNPGVLFID
jgi:D-lactate dehydrogenase (cytochrome)